MEGESKKRMNREYRQMKRRTDRVNGWVARGKEEEDGPPSVKVSRSWVESPI